MASKFNKKQLVKTLQIFAAYLVAAWTFLQFVDWVLNRYNISPYWVDILLWFFIGIVPSLLIYLYHQERINKRLLKLREKIIFPLNILLLFIAIYFGFGNSDLGATTKEINFTNDKGEAKSATITKEEFRIGLPIYGFKNVQNNDSLSWLEYGIGSLLVYDLEQNKSISPISSHILKTSDKISSASIFYDLYVDGEYEKLNDSISIKVYIRKSNNAKVLHQNIFKGLRLLDLLDDISIFITENVGFTETNAIRYLDYPISEFMSNSEDAVREFIDGDYDKAIELDSTFAMAYLNDAKKLLHFNTSLIEAQDIIDKAYTYRNKLPIQKQLEVNIQRNLAYENFEDAEKQVKLQLEVDPNNQFYNRVLSSIYGKTKQLEADFEKSKALFEKDPNPINGVNMVRSGLVASKENYIISAVNKYELINPDLKFIKINPYLFQGKISQAEALLNEIRSNPHFSSNRLKPLDSAIPFLKRNKVDISMMKQFEGQYRNRGNEQTVNLWVENNRIIRYAKNQIMSAYMLAGENSIVGGEINQTTYKIDLVKQPNGKVIGYIFNQFRNDNTDVFWYWKEDKSILEAHDAYKKSDDMIQVKALYELAFKNNPYHSYLKNIIEHINYIESISPEDLLKQHQEFAGKYGSRQFFLRDNKFYYKRKDENEEVPRIQLLPLDKNRYMDLTRLNTIMGFVEDSSDKIASLAWVYNREEQKWDILDDERNYFLKDN